MKEISGKFVTIQGERYYEIQHFDAMQPFFISIASESDLWMYVSSNGSLTAGRRNPDNALFPYYTDDKITDSAEITGSKTIVRIPQSTGFKVWEPFSCRNEGIYAIERSIAKCTTGNKLLFKEINHDLGLTFSYLWTNSDHFGFIRKSWLTNHSDAKVACEMIDGIQNILPAGIDRATQNEYSTLVDGYKKTERIADSTLALYRMEAILVDRAEPSESLRVNTVWSTATNANGFLLGSTQLSNFRRGMDITTENESKGVRGAYFVYTTGAILPGEELQQYIVAGLNQDADDVAARIHFLQTENEIAQQLEKSIAEGTATLKALVAGADGIQHTADENGSARHFSNVLFNLMRGGIYNDNYTIEGKSFSQHVTHFNKSIALRHKLFLSQLKGSYQHPDLQLLVQEQNDPQLYRLFQEYLPLTFSRRHGDPSRPWNNFNIRVKDSNGNKLISWQGNWRDIFQNWEALSLSYPLYINGIIAKFLNASTVDGYNPYRITSEGIDWEEIEPNNPWSNIGYWGDHQIIYLLKLLELSADHAPASFSEMLANHRFASANVPYRIKSYAQIVNNPKDTILFDSHLHHQIHELENELGADARLVRTASGEVKLVSFTEKMLVTLLAKLTNLIPGAGIWMNTLRPEWNDANNALVGTGASMVTLYYLRRFIDFLERMYLNTKAENLTIGDHLYTLMQQAQQILDDFTSQAEKGFDTRERRRFTDKMGVAAENYRNAAYQSATANEVSVSKNELQRFFTLALKHIDHTLAINQRNDHLYHAYNLVRFTGDGIEIRYLSEMLEGQVAVLSSGKLSGTETQQLLDALRNSALYRADQQSYMLYPNKKLSLFMDKNTIPEEEVNAIPLLVAMLQKGDTQLISRDIYGKYHFNAGFNNAGFLQQALQKLSASGEITLQPEEQNRILDFYEKVFDHQSFTGRSGTFYKYEGLGSIYWHMVSKLLLAIAENIEKAQQAGESAEIIARLRQHYHEVKKGIGAHKQPQEYGSFPFDPYSHTPVMAGVQQPGMTGQVKEDIISRFMELGILVDSGRIRVEPGLLRDEEFISGNGAFPELSFSYCAVPFIYRKDGKTGTEVIFSNGSTEENENYHLSSVVSKLVFGRSKEIASVIVHF